MNMVATPASPLAASDFLQRVAAELAECHAMLTQIEGTVQPHLTLQGHDRFALQNIDLLGQTLADLARCLTAAAQTRAIGDANALCSVDVLSSLHLDDLRTRLTAGHDLVATRANVELF